MHEGKKKRYNALKSGELEKEISSHIATKRQLEKANKRLEKISSMDRLTSINIKKDMDEEVGISARFGGEEFNF